jgi:hypothetical protein
LPTSGRAVCGILLLLFGAFLFSFFLEGYEGRVYNLGLMQDQLVGILVGLACMVVGLFLLFLRLYGRRR